MPDKISFGEPSTIARDPRDWARGFEDQAVLDAERQAFGRHAWELLGMVDDIPAEGDWFRTTLAGKSIFVQRFRDGIVAFENVCPHRFYPLRTEAKGNGIIRCGLHAWVFNRQGRAVGIPECEEVFGANARDLDKHLSPIDIAFCGRLIFGRLPPSAGTASPGRDLESYLGETAGVLKRLTGEAPMIGHVSRSVRDDETQEEVRREIVTGPLAWEAIGHHETTAAANWKLSYHLTLEDYHIVTVHADSFGAFGYLKRGSFVYYGLGLHSAMLIGPAPMAETALADFLAGCAEGEIDRNGYKIFHIFPNMLLTLSGDGTLSVVRLQALGTALTMDRTWLYRLRLPDEAPYTEAQRQEIVAGSTRIHVQDGEAAERLQQSVRQIRSTPLLGGQEERIGWFDAAYIAFMAADPVG